MKPGEEGIATKVTGGLLNWLGYSTPAVPAETASKQHEAPFSIDEATELMGVVHALSSVGHLVQVPRVVVVGSQSSGKSTVLNTLIGIDLLPTGGSMVTRVPLNLQLIPTPLPPSSAHAAAPAGAGASAASASTSGSASASEGIVRGGVSLLASLTSSSSAGAATPSSTSTAAAAASGSAGPLGAGASPSASPSGGAVASASHSGSDSDNKGPVVVVDFGSYTATGAWVVSRSFTLSYPRPAAAEIAAVREMIEQETVRLAGPGKNIASTPIDVKVTSPGATPLSITDLPGLTSIALQDLGQPKDIKEQIEALVLENTRQERTIIVAVFPAREDPETDPAMLVVKRADPTGARSVGVLTKVDLMNKGTDITPLLAGVTISTSIRFGHGYYAVRNRGPAEAHLTVREGFAAEAQFFAANPAYRHVLDRVGTEKLARRLGRELVAQVRRTLPDVIRDVQGRGSAVSRELAQLGTSVPEDHQGRISHLSMLLSKFAYDFTAALGAGSALNYGGRIKDTLVQCRKGVLAVDPFAGKGSIDDAYLARALSAVQGNRMAILIPPVELLHYCLTDPARRPIMKLEGLTTECANALRDLLRELGSKLTEDPGLARFPEVARYISDRVLASVLDEGCSTAVSRVRDILEAEEGYVWTDDPAFIETVRKHLARADGVVDPNNLRGVLSAYFHQVTLSVCNAAPKLFMKFIVNGTAQALHHRLVADLPSDPASLESLCREGGGISEKRRVLRAELNCISTALSVLKM